jgi:arginine-tRNA-protein transferase
MLKYSKYDNKGFKLKVYEVVDSQEKCSYLPDMYQQNHYKFVQGCTKEFCTILIQRGWRRFGKMFFRPICKTCEECQSMRIDVDNFTLSKSIKKSINRNKNTRVVVKEPIVTNEHIALFNKYHYHMHIKKGWKFHRTSITNYYESFISGHSDFGKEVAYYIDNKLVGVDFIDLLDDGISAIYFFYDPDYAWHSLGVYSIYKEIELAKELGLKWIYLGYYVRENNGLNYKIKYQPSQVLEGRPAIEDEIEWNPMSPQSGI